MSNKRYGLGGLLALALMAQSGESSANGRYPPAANDIVFNRADPNHMLLRTTFGFLQTRDGGENWDWICERGTGNPDNLAYDPPIALMGDGTAVISVTFGGARTSGDFCDWAPPPFALSEKLVVDSTWIPNDPAGALLLTSNWSEFGYVNVIWTTRDNARTWLPKNVQGDPRAFLHTVEVAPSNTNRIYVTGSFYRSTGDSGLSERVGQFLRSDDGGVTWSTFELSLPGNGPGGLNDATAFISGIDPNNADRVYLRVAHLNDPKADGASPTTLRVTHDGGATWHDVFSTNSACFGDFPGMLGFALSPDGRTIVLGGQFGIYSGPAPTPASPNVQFTKISDVKNRCLRWASSGIYACGQQPEDPFTLARSTDGARTFKALLRRGEDVCPLSCPSGSPVQNTCPGAWNNASIPSLSISYLISANETCCGAASTQASCRWPNGPTYGGGDVGATCPSSGPSQGCGSSAATATLAGCSTRNAGFAAPGLLGVVGGLMLAWRRRRKRRSNSGTRVSAR